MAAAAAAVVRGKFRRVFPSSQAHAHACARLLFQMRVFYYVILLAGSTPSRSAGFLGTSSPGPMADLYGTASQESAVSSYLSAASPAPSTGFSHSLGVRPFDLFL